MIKIIISGTYDGFYPRYATDGVLDDSICKKLLDRRMYFSKAEDSLFKEGYSFQCVGDAGVFFHKIILLFDALGRDGFMMASLFLPDGDKLDGKDIKDTLDSIIRDYKAHTSNGIASIDIDWSFAKSKADELKVHSEKWDKHPTNSNASRTALIKGVENRIADYFNYPNPLLSVFADYEQVFLTGSLLDPAMISDNGEQGYKVLEKEVANIDNPKYTIVFENQQEDASLSDKRRTITKKELESHKGNIPFGTYSKSGYRTATVEIIDKTSKDGSTIIVALPTLRPKSATLELKIVDKDTGEEIPKTDITIEWSNPLLNKKQKTQYIGSISFNEEDCDTFWYYTLKCNQYESFSGDVYIKDGTNESKEIRLIPKPKWSIDINLPQDNKTHTGILDEELEEEINQIKSEQTVHSSGLTAFTGGTINMPEKPKTSYFLRLDINSKKYSLFKKYLTKVNVVQQVKKNLTDKNKLEPIVTEINKIKQCIQAGDVYNAKEALETLNDLYDAIHQGRNIIQDTIKAIEKGNRIPDVVIAPKDIKYDPTSHRLICERTELPMNESVVLGKDKYKYSIPKPIWNKEECDTNVSIVNRTLLNKYKIVYWLVGLLALIIIITTTFLFAGNGKKLQDIKDQMSEISTTMSGKYPNSYCGDSLYSIADSLNNIYMKLASKENGLLEDNIYKVFYNTFGSQSKLKRKDNQVFHEALALFNVPIENFNQEKWDKLSQDFKVLTIEHQDTLKSKFDDRKKQLNRIMETAAVKAEKELYDKCMDQNATILLCDNFIQKYPNSSFIEDVKQRKQNLSDALESMLYNACFTANDTIENCKEYLKHFKDSNNQRVEKVKGKKRDLENAQNSEPVKTTSNNVKEKIKNKESLFKALTWENVENEGKKLYSNYDIIKEYKDRTKTIIENAGKAGKKKYNAAYDYAKNRNLQDLAKKDRLYYLEIELNK